MKVKIQLLLVGIITILTSCIQNQEKNTEMKYTSAITFLYYNDFNYGIDFLENTLQLDLVMDQGFARVYQVNEKAYLGIVQNKDSSSVAGNTLFSLTTTNVEGEYQRVHQLEVYNMTEIKHFESIPLKSFFFDDKEGHKFEIQQFMKEEDVQQF
ncbi:VOC family protein [Carboxylicivirga marina]|uniref:VOC family protein n=1 Tax=Carboxylicivirga marina TaxID=2800988 RepID=A0ABS1HPP9_9BACT|nr:VOC family protein [Carboxylicivirga marina]MBK3519566.1 VOC family protein [Carboxylicivirga marina]